MTHTLNVEGGAANERLDVYLAKKLKLPRASVKRLLEQEHVNVNGSHMRPSYQTQTGDIIVVDVPDEQTAPVVHSKLDLPILYEDQDLLVVDKPAGLLVHPGNHSLDASTVAEPTVVDFIRSRTTDPDPDRPGIVHRLDRDTSGLLVLAKTLPAKTALQQAFRAHSVQKTYLALVIGQLKPKAATIDLPTGRDPGRPLRRAVVQNGRPSTTSYKTLATYPGYTLAEVKPATGRTHQLRVHFATLGHPIAGDTTYGPPSRPAGLSRQFLHATKLEFKALSGARLEFESPLPPDLESFLSRPNDSS